MVETSQPGRTVRIDGVLVEVSGRPDLLARIIALLDQIGGRVEVGPLDEQVQENLARLSRVLPYLLRLKNSEINVAQAELAVRMLLSPMQEKKLAVDIVDDLVRRRNVYDSAFQAIRYGRTPATFVLLGVVSHAMILAPAIYGLSRVFPCRAGEGAVCWEAMAIAGAVGGATSLLSRLQQIAALSRWSSEGDPLQLFYTGLLKPGVGIVAGLFAYAALSSGLIAVHVPVPGAPAVLSYAALAFLSGFSERFATDLIDSASDLRDGGER